jgi:hypothetical protein
VRYSFLLFLAIFTTSRSTLAAAAAPPTLGQQTKWLDQAASINRDLYASLESFVCREQMERYRGKLSSQSGHLVDVISAKVSLENGTEHYSDLWQKNRNLRDLAELDGAWSEGEFGTLLKQTEQLLRTQHIAYESEGSVTGRPALIFRLDIPADSSPWDLAVGGQHYKIPFIMRVWIARDSKKILKIVRASTEVPGALRISEIDWAVTLAPVELSGKVWLLPSSGEYQVGYRDTDRREWNEMKFFDYHHYAAEATLRFN